ncbi:MULTISPECIES: hypothetical protein [unclassified Methylobacterium]|nr:MULTISPECIES: hypothetical protein [unclassified Methylobacterium]
MSDRLISRTRLDVDALRLDTPATITGTTQDPKFEPGNGYACNLWHGVNS